MSVVVTVKNGSTDITSSIEPSSVDIVIVLTKEVGTFSFDVIATPGKYVPALNDAITITETVNGTPSIIFGGTVTEIETTVKQGLIACYSVTVTDYGFKANQKLVVQGFTNADPGTIAAGIVTGFFPAGYSTAGINMAGYTIPSIKFNYMQPTKALQKLANLIGWNWYIDSAKVVHFFLAQNNPAPFNLDDTTGNFEWATIDADQSILNMKNSVYVIGATYPVAFTIGTTPDTFSANGVQAVFYLRYRYGSGSVVVTLNGVGQTVGIANQDSPGSFQVLYDSTNQNITFSSVPSSGTIAVFGTAAVPIIGKAIDSASVLTYGEFEDAIFDSQITTVAEAQGRARAEILQYGHAVSDIKFYTTMTGLRIGQNINVTSSKLGITLTGLVIKRIEARMLDNMQLRYYVELLGSDNITFVDMMSSILQQENATTQVSDTTVLQPLLTITETLASSDTLHAPVATTTRSYYWNTVSGGQQPIVWNLFTWA